MVTGGDFDLYCYTVIGAKGEAEALAAVQSVVTPGTGGLRARVVTVETDDFDLTPQPPRTPG